MNKEDKKQMIKNKLAMSRKIKNKSKVALQMNLMNQDIFKKELIQFRICMNCDEVTPYLEELFIKYAKQNITNKCHKQGFISDRDISVVKFSSAKMIGSKLYFDVLFEFTICYPYEEMIFKCKIHSITKIGIKAILSDDDDENPIVVFASRVHNQNIFTNEIDVEIDENMDDDDQLRKGGKYSEGSIITVSAVGHRFEINDSHITILGKIMD